MQSTNFKSPLVVFLALIAALVAMSVQAAELPELGNPATGSGAPTTAAFFGAATADGGVSFLPEYAPSDVLSIPAAIEVEAGHVNSFGNLYLVVALEDFFFMQVDDGSFAPWDGNPLALQPFAPAKVLQAREEFTIIEGIPFGAIGLANTELYIFLAYDTQQKPNELYFSGQPIVVSLTEDVPQIDTYQLYVDTVSAPVVQNKCVICHRQGGLAGTSNLVYALSSQPDYQQINYDLLEDYILNTPGGSDLILTKPTGVTHGGGVVIGTGSSEFAALSEFVDAVLANNSGSGGSAQVIFEDVELLNNVDTLRKAALLFAGRLPTAQELAAVEGADEMGLRNAIRALMNSTGFEDFLIESANDNLLTLAYEASLFQIVNRYRYPNSMQYYQAPNFYGSDRRLTAEALAMEPLKLISHVVTQERPYTEILTADYVMVNPWSAEIYGGDVQFDNPNDWNEWREGRITDYFRCMVCAQVDGIAQYNIPTVYPHAGILNSPAFLSRFESTSTNRNRARSRWAYYFFLGVDIEGLSERTTDPDALADEDNPTLNNENCTVCHNIMDPVAGAFQNYGDDGFFRDQPGGMNSLPASYRFDQEGLYQPGDTWYADMLAPGFGTELAPDPDNSLQWLAQQFVADSRFGTGTVKFWFPAVIGREPIPEPENPEDFGYAAKLAAYASEQALINQIAADFVAGAQGNGDHNLKDLLSDLALSGFFRAESSAVLDDDKNIQLNDLGTGQLLSPEQLNRKVLEITGYDWRYGIFSALNDAYPLMYGGIDSLGITERASDLTTMMSTVVATMANETACVITAEDFGRAQQARLLFPHVELANLPTGNLTPILTNIQYLHDRLLGESLAVDATEILATFSLFSETWQARIDAGKGSEVNSPEEVCLFENAENPVTEDSNQTLRAWAVVLNYLMRDYRFIHE